MRNIQPLKNPGFLVSHVNASRMNDIITINSANLQFTTIITIIIIIIIIIIISSSSSSSSSSDLPGYSSTQRLQILSTADRPLAWFLPIWQIQIQGLSRTIQRIYTEN